MAHAASSEDRAFLADFEAHRLSPARLDHRAHVRLAFTYLVEHDPETALASIRSALQGFLRHHGVAPDKYHETMTRAWLLAVRHFMELTQPCPSADALMERCPVLLDAKIMMTHYSADLLFSEEARARFLEPNLQPIPRHGD